MAVLIKVKSTALMKEGGYLKYFEMSVVWCFFFKLNKTIYDTLIHSNMISPYVA